MIGYIDGIINELPLRLHTLNYDGLFKDSIWIGLPTIVKLYYLDRNLGRYCIEDQLKIQVYILAPIKTEQKNCKLLTV